MEKYSKNFIELSTIKHHNKYDYSLCICNKSHDKVKIICPKHGIFEQLAYRHLKGHGCKKCSDQQNGKNRRFTKEFIINKFKDIHGDKFDYSLVNYINIETKVKIICKYHGIFYQTPSAHINHKQGCPKCVGRNKDNKDIINKYNVIHNNYYDYSLMNYKNNKTKIKIICPNHGVFEQLPYDHLNGCGCAKCKKSKNEILIETILIDNDIKFESQKMFDGCIYKRKLKFDFYLPLYNVCIEYDGEQHFERYRFEKDNNRLNIRKIRDQIKTEYCKNNNIKLIRIKYNEEIDKILLKKLKI